MKILILGHGEHGKDKLAKFIRDIHGLTFESSSWAVAELVAFPRLQDWYRNLKECYEDRRDHRLLWKNMITAYNTPDKARLQREVLKRCDMYVGLRCDQEFAAGKHLYDLILWVDASQRHPVDPSMSIEFDPSCMIKIDNNGTIADLVEQVSYGSELHSLIEGAAA